MRIPELSILRPFGDKPTPRYKATNGSSCIRTLLLPTDPFRPVIYRLQHGCATVIERYVAIRAFRLARTLVYHAAAESDLAALGRFAHLRAGQSVSDRCRGFECAGLSDGTVLRERTGAAR